MPTPNPPRYRLHRNRPTSQDLANQWSNSVLFPQNDALMELDAAPTSPDAYGHILQTLDVVNAGAAAVDCFIGGLFPASIWCAGPYDVSATPDFYVDDTTDAQDVGAADFLVGADGQADGIFVASTRKFNVFVSDVSTAGTAGLTWTWTYWNGSSYAALNSVVVDVNYMDATIEMTHLWDIPPDWAASTGAAGEGGIDVNDATSATQSTLTGLYIIRGINSGPATAPILSQLHVGRLRYTAFAVAAGGTSHAHNINQPVCGNDERLVAILSAADTAGANVRVLVNTEVTNFAQTLGA